MTFKTFPKPGKTKRAKPNKKERSEFPPAVRAAIVEHYGGMCGHCGRSGEHIHHVKPKGSGGRGVFANGILLCAACHTKIHMNAGMMNQYKRLHETLHGPDYYRDEMDKGEQPC